MVAGGAVVGRDFDRPGELVAVEDFVAGRAAQQRDRLDTARGELLREE